MKKTTKKKTKKKKRRRYFTPKQRAWHARRRELHDAGLNLSDEILKRIFELEWKGRPRVRARVQPTSDRPKSVETIVQHADGSTTYIESHSVEQIRHKRGKKRKWRTRWSKTVRGGRFSLAETVKGRNMSLGFTGGGHRAFLILDKWDKQALQELIGEDEG